MGSPFTAFFLIFFIRFERKRKYDTLKLQKDIRDMKEYI